MNQNKNQRKQGRIFSYYFWHQSKPPKFSYCLGLLKEWLQKIRIYKRSFTTDFLLHSAKNNSLFKVIAITFNNQNLIRETVPDMQSEDYFGDWRDFLITALIQSCPISKETGRGSGSLLLMHFRKQLLIRSGCTFLNLCFCRCHLYCWTDGLFNGFEFWFMQSSAYWVLENSEWHEASALPCINCFHLVYWNSSCYSKMGLISITQAEKGTTNFNVISLKIAKAISCTIQLWAKQTIL